ncbi:hypothetical protein BJAS_P1724 [Bathymodiolus japonicus methanotrophic gill symbiont]|nr:hypothetical protein BJAS_P1724 [Bathymodiolus japonicus methanotrophic gill symbiont]
MKPVLTTLPIEIKANIHGHKILVSVRLLKQVKVACAALFFRFSDFICPLKTIQAKKETAHDKIGSRLFIAKACFGHPSPSKQQKLNATTYASGGPDSSSSPRPDPTRGRNIGSK